MLIIASLVACNLPAQEPTATPLSIDAAFTAAAETVEARLTSAAQTQAAAGPPATNTSPPASATPTPPAATFTPVASPTKAQQTCDVASFVTDVTVPDGTNYSAGSAFTKTWRIKNVGDCSWTPSYTLFFSSGASMSGPSSTALTGNVNPGQSVDISINLTAPATAGDYTGFWNLRNAAGLSFIQVYVKITVGGGSGSGATVTPTPDGGEFAVTHVNFVSSGGCGDFTTIAQITTNGAGTVSYYWVRSDGATDTEPHPVLTYDAAGTKTVNTSWNASGTGDYWIDIYIDDPNHQQIGRASFTCP
jgi:hypothetical protein